jgi:hypothetical protein
MRRTVAHFAVAATAAVLLSLLLAAAGCQERVISETYRPMTGMPGGYSHSGQPYSPNVERPPVQRKNAVERALDDIGDALFGWMDDDEQPAATPAPRGRTYDPIWIRDDP